MPGFAISTDLAAMKANAQTPAILAAVRNWEVLRLANRFSPAQRAALRGPREFHLERTGTGEWQLRPLAFSRTMTCDLKPGQPAHAAWEIENPFAAQPLRLVLRAAPSGNERGRLAGRESLVGSRRTPVHLCGRVDATRVPSRVRRSAGHGLRHELEAAPQRPGRRAAS